MGAIYLPDHADGCACDACMLGGDGPQLIHVGLPHLSDEMNGYAIARADGGEVMVKVSGRGLGELSMPKAEATALRDQLNNALAQV